VQVKVAYPSRRSRRRLWQFASFLGFWHGFGFRFDFGLELGLRLGLGLGFGLYWAFPFHHKGESVCFFQLGPVTVDHRTVWDVHRFDVAISIIRTRRRRAPDSREDLRNLLTRYFWVWTGNVPPSRTARAAHICVLINGPPGVVGD
jgi:hypothetical protein